MNILMTLVAASTLAATAPTSTINFNSGWVSGGYENRRIVEDNSTNFLVASASSEDGRGIVFICGAKSGLTTVISLEASRDLIQQIGKTQSFTRARAVELSVGDSVSEDVWMLKRMHGTLQPKSKSTTITLLNAAFSGKAAKLNIDGTGLVELKLPEPDSQLTDFIESCPATRATKA
jgi:hypothetical protein